MTTEEKKQLAEKVIVFLNGLSVYNAKDVLRYAIMDCEKFAKINPSVREVL